MKKLTISNWSLTLLLLLNIFFNIGCNEEKVSKKLKNKLVIYTTFYPVKYFTQQITDDLATVICPVPLNEDAIFWQPDKKVIKSYSQADAIVINGAEFSKWVQKSNLPQSKIIDSAKPLKNSFIFFENSPAHIHGSEGQHVHEGLDGHTWVDPVNALIQAKEILDNIVQKYPQHKKKLHAGYAALKINLEKLDQQFNEISQTIGNQPLFASHPAFNYIARRYAWNIKNFDLDPNVIPTAEDYKIMRQQLEIHPSKYLIWESAPLPQVVQKISKETGLKSIVFSPCELMNQSNLDRGADYLTIMNENIQQLKNIQQSDAKTTVKSSGLIQNSFSTQSENSTENSENIELRSIGTFHTNWNPDTGAPRQGILEPNSKAVIEIKPAYRNGLADLEKFQHIILIYSFNLTKTWSPMVKPPGSSHSFGIFATRSPKRPNPIGFSVVTLDKIDIEKGLLYISGVDAFEGTPLLDIKPYLPSIDRFDSPINAATEIELGHHDELMIKDSTMYR